MTRVCAIVTCLVLATTGTSMANPLGSSGTAQADGFSCNFPHIVGSSKAPQEKHRATPRQPLDITAAGQAPDETARKSLAKRIKPTSVAAALDKNQASPPVAAAAKQEPSPSTAAVAAASPNVQPEVRVIERTPQEQVMAALQIAAQITAAETPGPNARSDEASDAGAPQTRDTTKLVALLISKADTKSVSALTGANIAIDAAQSGAENDIRTSLAAAGATEVQLKPGDTKPVDRVIWGEVPAAVVGLVSSDAAEAFPEVKGYKVLRVPLVHQDKG
jgi:hypothetical protein